MTSWQPPGGFPAKSWTHLRFRGDPWRRGRRQPCNVQGMPTAFVRRSSPAESGYDAENRLDKLINDYDIITSTTRCDAQNKVWQKIKKELTETWRQQYKALYAMKAGTKHTELEAFRIKMVGLRKDVAEKKHNMSKHYSKVDLSIGAHYLSRLLLARRAA